MSGTISPRWTPAITWPLNSDHACMGPALPTIRRVAHAMGMPISLALRGPDLIPATADPVWTAVMDDIARTDAVFSTYRSDSVITRINRGELTVSDGPAELAKVLALAERAGLDSDGAFSAYRADRTPTGSNFLDPSGVVKGWAVQRAAHYLDLLPDADYCLSAGGDLICRVRAADRPAWRIGIEDPTDPQHLVETVEVRNGAVATSGTAHRGAHIIDPRTGRPPTGVLSVSVVADSLVDADIDATSAYLMGMQAAAWLRGRPDRAGIVVWSDATRTVIT